MSGAVGAVPGAERPTPGTGGDAIFDVVDRKLQFRSYFKLPAPQTEQENCVAHNGSLVPVPGRDIMVQAWYQGGISEGILQPLEAPETVQSLIRDFRLHAGEAEAVALAKEHDAACGTDDARAIRSCKALGIRFTTAVGLLVAMAEAGELDGARASEALLQLERFGRYHPRILEDAAARIRAVGAVGGKR